MRRALVLLALLLAACSSAGKKPDAGAKGGEGAPPSAELVDACAKHLELLHRIRLFRELSRDGLAALAGTPPAPGDLDASTKRLEALGLEGDADAFTNASGFAQLAQPTVARAGYSFLGWTPDLDDVGLARIRARRPGQWKQLWTKALDYEVLLLDGFTVPDYPRIFEETTGHKASARDKARLRGRLLVIDAAGLSADVKRAVAEKRPGAEVVAKASEEDLLKEIELREAGYLRFQDEVASSTTLDQAVTWLEVLEGDPDLALTGGLISSGDGPDELRRAGAVQAIIVELAASDAKEEKEVLSLPPADRRKKLEELAPQYLRAKLGH